MTLPLAVADALTQYLDALSRGEKKLRDLHDHCRAVGFRDTSCDVLASRNSAPPLQPFALSSYPRASAEESAHARLAHEALVAQETLTAKAIYEEVGTEIRQAQYGLHQCIEQHRIARQRGLVILTNLAVRNAVPHLSWTWFLSRRPEEVAQQALVWKRAQDGHAHLMAATCLSPMLRLTPYASGDTWTFRGPTENAASCHVDNYPAPDRTQALILGAWMANPFLLARPQRLAVYQHYSPLQQSRDIAAFLHPAG